MTAATTPMTPERLDALREVANIGAGHAATAMSEMIGSTIMITVPRVNVGQLEELPPVVTAPEEPVAAVLLHMMGDLSGRTLLVLPKAAALRLAELMLHRSAGTVTTLNELEQSAIEEAGNILSSAYLSALANFMGMVLLPSPPIFVMDRSTTILTDSHLRFGLPDERLICVESEFVMKEVGERLRGFFLMLPDPASLDSILRAVRVL